MKTIQRATESQEPRVGQTRRRGLLVLVLSLALVVAACSSDDDSSDTTLAPTTTAAATTTAAPTTTAVPTTTVAPESADGVPPQIATVTAMYDALNAHDADAYAVYWAEDAVGWGPMVWGNDKVPVGSPEMEKGFEERRAWGAHFTLSDCQLVDEEVRCLETWDDRVYHGMAGLTVQREAFYTFDEQGMITTMINGNFYSDEVLDWQAVFGPWMQATYPEIAETYLVPGFDKSFKREVVFASPESIADFTGLIEEFVAQSDEYPLSPAA